MGDHLALLVDRLLTESTLEAAIKNRKQTQFGPVSPLPDNDARQPESSNIAGFGEVGSAHKLVECRICQEEDFDLNLEAPCSCCGSLKYAHKKCIQRWCNEKGDTTCEICLQQFKPGYTAPQHLFHYGSLPMNFRGSWEVSRQGVQDSQVITMVPSDRDIIGEYDEYSTRTTSSICCRSVAVIFMILLVLRHALPILIGGAEQYPFALFSLLVLRVAGVIFPLVVIARALMAFHRRRRQQQEAREIDTLTDTEADTVRLQLRTIQLH